MYITTKWKVAGSIPDGVIGIFHRRNTSGHTVARGVDSASNRNEYQFVPPWGGKGGRYVRLTTLPPSCADCLEILEPQPSWNPQGPLQVCNGIALPAGTWGWQLYHLHVPIVLKSWNLNLPGTLRGLSRPVHGLISLCISVFYHVV
jgi:hypothetical protein